MEVDFAKIRPSINFNFNFSRKSQVAMFSTLKEAICFNQGKYIEFEYLVGEKHKALKNALSQTNPSIEEIASCHEKLVKYIYNQLSAISKRNFEYLLRYYSLGSRSRFPARICIKLARDNYIVDAFRQKRIYRVESHPIDRNTGFKYVFDNGTYYLRNNLPGEAIRGLYINPRLDDQRVRNYKPPRFHRDIIDFKWCDCWNKDPGPIPADWNLSCYKSTLIVPMTLINNELDNEFKDSFFNVKPYNNRTIWGFLCFDHPTVNYFKEDEDMSVGYIFADVLSLYFLSTHIHTSISNTFGKASSKLNKGETVYGESITYQ